MYWCDRRRPIASPPEPSNAASLGAIGLQIFENHRRQSIGVAYAAVRQGDDLFGDQPGGNVVDRLEAQTIAYLAQGQGHRGYHLRLEGLLSQKRTYGHRETPLRPESHTDWVRGASDRRALRGEITTSPQGCS